MPLHDAVGINCEKGASTENKFSGVKYIGKGVYLDDCVCMLYDLTTTPPWWLEIVMVYYIFWVIVFRL